MVLNYLREKNAFIRHVSNRSLIAQYKSDVLSRTSRLAVPYILTTAGVPSTAILWTGDADVIPFKCDYFQSIPSVMRERNVPMYMDGPWDMSIPRYTMCYIAGYLSVWHHLTESGSSVDEVMANTLHSSNVQVAYNDSNRTVPDYDFDEHFVGRRIKRLSYFPNCTTHGQDPVRNFYEQIRGPGRPPYNWTEALGDNSLQTLQYLGNLIEAHSGTGVHSLYGKTSWPLFHGLLAVYMEKAVVARLSAFATSFFQLQSDSML